MNCPKCDSEMELVDDLNGEDPVITVIANLWHYKCLECKTKYEVNDATQKESY